MVGAKSVNGPVPDNVVVMPAACKATPKVFKLGVELITCAIVSPETSVVIILTPLPVPTVAVPVLVTGEVLVIEPVAVVVPVLVKALVPASTEAGNNTALMMWIKPLEAGISG